MPPPTGRARPSPSSSPPTPTSAASPSIGSEWERCDLSKVSFRDTDLSNAYFHGGRLQDCDFRGANLEGATFEKLKLLRCDFTGAQGLDELEFDEVDMDRVVGLDGAEAPPPPPPPAHGVTSFTREQRAQVLGVSAGSDEPSLELPPFRPQDPPSALLYRGLKRLPQPPPWVLDVPGLRPQTPQRLAPGHQPGELLPRRGEDPPRGTSHPGGPGGGGACAAEPAPGQAGRRGGRELPARGERAAPVALRRGQGAQGPAARRGGRRGPHRADRSPHHRRAARAAPAPRRGGAPG